MTESKRPTCVAFPGQGIQKPGMASKIVGTPAWHLFEEASAILGYDLGKLCLEGPEDVLNNTSHAQVAIFVTCYSLWQLGKERYQAALFLGHSLGEITALGAAGAFSFVEGVRLTQARGELMAGGPKGGMAAILGLEVELVYELCALVGPEGICQVANENSPAQAVVSGDARGLERLTTLALEKGAKRVVPLNVSGPFHSRLMEPVAREFAKVVEDLEVRPCHTPVLSNDGETMLTNPGEVKDKLVTQITGSVRFTRQVQKLAQMGLEEFVEVSPESLLMSMARRIEPNLQFTLVTGGGI